jgi:hypothetical protein
MYDARFNLKVFLSRLKDIETNIPIRVQQTCVYEFKFFHPPKNLLLLEYSCIRFSIYKLWEMGEYMNMDMDNEFVVRCEACVFI